MIEPATLRYFREVAEHGSIRQAAERLFVAQSAVSRQIAILEAELGVQLFERRARGMELTDPGRLLLVYADDMHSRLDELRMQIQEYETLQRGHVEIACVEGLLASFLPEALRLFSQEYPGITLLIRSIGSHAVAEAAAEHRCDVGIVFGTPPRNDLVELARMDQPLCAIVAPQHPLARRPHCSLRDVASYPVVLPDRSFGIRQLIDRVSARGRITLKRTVETNTLAFACRLVSLVPDRVTFMPEDTVLPEVDSGRLVALPLTEKVLRETRVTLVAGDGRKLSPAARLLAQRLTELMKNSSGKRRRRPRSPGRR